MAKAKKFKEVIDKLLMQGMETEAFPESVRRLAKKKRITYLEAIILSQISKAIAGDTSATNFLRDSSGNKLKECTEQRVSLKFEDL